ncbi:MAG TPA: hypothetical protein VE954_06645 [Oligoflexus sp.]|uniref:hypothetical protein n=1 Tax=Oligoflexus sp. TaxID=1971216 RepID=UPI002D55B60B|nr:hypothetical protein [Oligoflexus sp.]HYX32775.1 hypothetical protein [Oligoflexus sp.]
MTAIPQARQLREMVRAKLLESLKIVEFVKSREESVQIHRFSDIGEQDPPLIIISTPEEVSKDLGDDPPSQRTLIHLMVDVVCPLQKADQIDAITYEVRRILSSMVFGKGSFEPIRHRKTITASYPAGHKLFASSAAEYVTSFDIEYDQSGKYEPMEGVKVNGLL